MHLFSQPTTICCTPRCLRVVPWYSLGACPVIHSCAMANPRVRPRRGIHTHTHTHTVQYNGCVTGGLFTKKRRGNRVGARRYQLPRPGNPLEVSDSQSSCKPRTHTRTHTSRHPWATLDSLDKWKIDFPGGPTISNRYIPRVLFMYARVEEYNCQRTVAFPIHQRHRRPSSVPLRLSLCSHTYTTTSIVPERSS
jgi:hypothetical protein